MPGFQQVWQELLHGAQQKETAFLEELILPIQIWWKKESYYIGKAAITKNTSDLVVIDWRALIASVYYESSLGPCTYSVKGEGAYETELSRKTYHEIENDDLKDFYDSDVVAMMIC